MSRMRAIRLSIQTRLSDRWLRRTGSVVVGLLVCVALVAQGTADPEGTLQKSLSPGEVDTKASRAYVFVDRGRLGHLHAVEGMISSGTIHLDAAEDSGKLVFDMTSFIADTEAARKFVGLENSFSEGEKVTATMRGEKVLDVKKHPTATFNIDSAKRLPQDSEAGHPRYELKGRFTLCGVTRPLTVIAENDQRRKGKLHLRGEFVIKQTDFGIKPYGFGLISVADELKIWGDMWLANGPAAPAQ